MSEKITVVIPTYNRAAILKARSIPSVLKQTYQNFELIIVGDCCTDNTEAIIKEFKDPRIRWENLKQRGNYPPKGIARWYVAGIVPMNRGYDLATGSWIADLDDDDEFLPNHLEDLLKCGTENQAGFVYGITKILDKKLIAHLKKDTIGEYPPRISGQTRSTYMHRTDLKLKYDINCWKINEPGDWNILKRALMAKVKVAFCNKVITVHYPERTNK